jgi:hypothetical protein
MRHATWMLAVVLLVAACGRVPSSSGAGESPSAGSSPSPTTAATPLAILSPTFHSGEVGLAYTPVTLHATGGVDPFLWRVSDGALPAGLTVSSDGVVSGTPSASGTFSFMVEVTDSAMVTTTVTGSINVISQLTVRPIGQLALHGEIPYPPASASYGATGQFGRVQGGQLPYTYAVVSGSLPNGARLINGLEVSDFPGQSGAFRFTVKVTDAMGAKSDLPVTIHVYRSTDTPPPWFCQGGGTPTGPEWTCT